MPNLNRSLNRIRESAIRKMTRIADEYGAINLAQGFPDFDPPKALKRELKKVAEKGPFQYSITWGSKEFRDALARKQSKFMGININPETEVVVTCGCTEAMIASIMAACEPGDKVIVFSPFYENYVPDLILAKAEPIYVSLYPPKFEFNKEELKRAFEQKPKAIILCNPSNPSGKVFTMEELQFIADLVKEHDTFVMVDQVYEHIVMKPNKYIYFASLPGMFERTFSCGSLSKTYAITGWRLGYVIGPSYIIDATRKVHDFLTICAPSSLQKAAMPGLNMPDEYYVELQKMYMDKRDYFLKGLDEAGLRYLTPQGAYYVLVDIGEFTSSGISDVEFAQWMAKEVGVAAVPGSSFFERPVNNLLRFHFAKKKETLKEAVDRLKTLKDKWQNRKN